jgi:transposase
MPAAQEAYDKWEVDLPDDVRPAFNDLTTAMRNWRTEIFTYFDTRVTNAYTESFNSLAKMVNRLGRGYSFEVLRAKLLLTRSCHKLERATCARPSDGLSMGRMTGALMVREDPPSRFLGVDISTLATELGKLPEKL